MGLGEQLHAQHLQLARSATSTSSYVHAEPRGISIGLIIQPGVRRDAHKIDLNQTIARGPISGDGWKESFAFDPRRRLFVETGRRQRQHYCVHGPRR